MKTPANKIAMTLLLALVSLPARAMAQDQVAAADEQFVPAASSTFHLSGGTLYLRPDATVPDGQIRLKNICRWADSDDAAFSPVQDLTVGRMSGNSSRLTVSLVQVRALLSDAGVNIALVNFSGAGECTVNRADDLMDERQSLAAWIASADSAPAATLAADNMQATTPTPALDPKSLHFLRDALTADLCTRLGFDPDSVEISFNPGDEKFLKLSEPAFDFDISPRNVRGLGEIAWDISISSGGQTHKITIEATARAWQVEAILMQPVACRQIIRDEDVAEKRRLVEQLPDDPLLAKAQAVGQEASRDLKPGTVLTARMVNPVLLARAGQLITVTAIRGTMKVVTVARACEGGTYGQSIRVRNDTDPTQTFQVTLSGPQEATVTGPATPPDADGTGG
jgi:flagella basal body P-ring formation protein FlgA